MQFVTPATPSWEFPTIEVIDLLYFPLLLIVIVIILLLLLIVIIIFIIIIIIDMDALNTDRMADGYDSYERCFWVFENMRKKLIYEIAQYYPIYHDPE